MHSREISRAEWAELVYIALIEHHYGPDSLADPDGTGSQRISWLLSWAELERTNADYNPLATSYRTDGSTDFNSAGVQSYPDIATGIAAVVGTLTGHDADTRGYTRIITVLFDQDCEFEDFRYAVAHSAWSGLEPAHYQIPATFAVTAIPGSPR